MKCFPSSRRASATKCLDIHDMLGLKAASDWKRKQKNSASW